MFDHVTIHASDRGASEQGFETLLGVLGVPVSRRGDQFTAWQDFSLAAASSERPATRGLHIGFVAASREDVDAFWSAGLELGWRDDGAPGPRPEYRHDYYGGFLRDPDGNSVEAVHHGALRRGGVIDHLWIRVADVAAARTFYDTLAPHAGLRCPEAGPQLVRFAGVTGSFSLVAGDTPTENVHLALPAARAQVDAFHAAIVAAGFRDNGRPGERARYHPGYYAAFALDPDGNNVELVDHGR